jgi:hypothetical protein
MKRLLGSLAFYGAASMLVLACGSSERETPAGDAESDVTPSVQELRVLESDEAAGKLVVEFTQAGRAITYDLRLGPKMLFPPSENELQARPELPSHEVDARISDAAGQVFHLQMGGDSFIDASWKMPRVANFNEAARLRDIRSLADAVPAFRKLRVPAGLDQLRLAAIDIGLGVERSPNKPELSAVEPELGELPSENPGAVLPGGTTRPQADIEWGPSSVAKWDFKVRYKNASVAGVSVPVHHSAVHLRGWSSSTSIVFNAYSCNHGTCAGSSAMNDRCVMPGFRTDDGTHSRFFYTSGCQTPYAWNSGPGHHNCNDDSAIQVRAIYYDSSQNRTSGICGAAGARYTAPYCSPE